MSRMIKSKIKLKQKLKSIMDQNDALLHLIKMSVTDKSKKNAINQYIGNRLHFARTLNGHTLEDIAERLGCRYQQVAKFISGKNALNVDQLVLWSNEMDVSMKWILKGLNYNKGGKNDRKADR